MDLHAFLPRESGYTESLEQCLVEVVPRVSVTPTPGCAVRISDRSSAIVRVGVERKERIEESGSFVRAPANSSEGFVRRSVAFGACWRWKSTFRCTRWRRRGGEGGVRVLSRFPHAFSPYLDASDALEARGEGHGTVPSECARPVESLSIPRVCGFHSVDHRRVSLLRVFIRLPGGKR